MVVGLAAIAVVVVVLIQTWQQRQLIHDHALERDAWIAERRELLNRIQRPEYTPTTLAPFELPELPEDQYNLVGTIAPPLEEN